jgi:hypothetical protein
MNDLVAGHVPSLIASTPTAQRARGLEEGHRRRRHPAGLTKPWRRGDGFAGLAPMSVEVATGRRGAALPLGNKPQHDDMTRKVLTGVRIRAVAG